MAAGPEKPRGPLGDNFMANSQQRFSDDAFPWYVRYFVRAFTYVLICPALWLIDKAGVSEIMWQALVRRVGKSLIAGHDFGTYSPSKNDVIIGAYPKCGQNWMLQIAYQITMRGAGEFRHIHDIVPWPDFAQQDRLISLQDEGPKRAAPTGLRVIKTHLEWEQVPYSASAHYLCIVRDPKDTFVSNYHFMRDVVFGPLMPTVPVWLGLFLSDTAPFVWPKHVAGYWENRSLSNLLILTYEDMKADLPSAIMRIAEFLKVELTDDEFRLVCEKSSFPYMKKNADKFKPPGVSPWSEPGRQMIRRGVSGGSAELLTEEQQGFIDRECESALRRSGSDFPYAELYGRDEK